MIYLDSCALVKLLLTEQSSKQLARYINENNRHGPVTSQLAVTEVHRALRRNNADKGRRADSPELLRLFAQAEALIQQISLVVIDLEILREAAAFLQPRLRTLDAIHLASAATLGDALTAFVTYDKRLAVAANNAGLPVLAPD